MSNPNPRTDQLAPKWRPGQSGNPFGRPRKRPQAEASDDLLRTEMPEVMRKQLNTIMVNGRATIVEILKKGATFADAIAYGLTKKAMQGDAAAAKELADRVEGKATQRIELQNPSDKRFEVAVTYAQPIKTIEGRREPGSFAGAAEDDRQLEDTIVKDVIEAAIVEAVDQEENE
jgi:hypothetical protein